MALRLYFQNQAAGYVPTTKRGGWTTSTSTGNRQMATTKFSTKTFSSVAAAAGGSTLYTRFVSTPFLQGGLIPNTATLNTMFGQLSAAGVYNLQAHIFVTAGNTDTLRGTLFNKASVNSTNTTTTETGRGMTNIAMNDGVTVQVGDRLVMDIGFNYISGTAGSPRVYFGGVNATDLSEGSTSTLLTGWIELSSNWQFLFEVPPPPAPAVALYLSTEGYDSVASTKNLSATAGAADLLILAAMCEEENVGFGALPSGLSLTWTERADIGAASGGTVGIFTAPSAGAAGPGTVSLLRNTSSTMKWAFDCLRVANASPGQVAQAASSGSVMSINLTTTQANSGIMVCLVDWNANDGALRVWQTVNGLTPTFGNSMEMRYFRNAINYTVYSAWYPDVGAIGTKLVGITATAVGGYSIAAIEVKPAGGGGGLVRPRPQPRKLWTPAAHRAASY